MRTQKKNDPPFVSVIVPMYNEEEYIADCLEALIKQDYPRNHFEIIVIDADSKDKSISIVNKYSTQYSNIHIKENPDKLISKAFNIGIAASRGDIIALMSSHALASPDYISLCSYYLQNTDAENVGGIMLTVGKGYWGEVIALAASSTFGIGNSKHRYANEEGYDDVGWPGAYWKKTLLELGGFDEFMGLNEDDDLYFRLVKKGKRAFYTHKIKTTYFSRKSLGGLWRQFYKYGYWKVRVLKKYGKFTSARHFIPSIFVSGLIISILLCIYSAGFCWTMYLILGPYVAASIMFSLRLLQKSKWKYVVSLPVIYAILHLSYGVGFLAGIPRFLFSKGKEKYPFI